ncbi:MAG: hypothetical protein LBE04_01885 [Prevotellaceae bacterium]|jgi:hypothetical protein|nr:hypothetical protein [Prevotellaceae bacterium]
MEDNLILYLPFDEIDGTIAYDYSASRADGILSEGAQFTKNAVRGRALDLLGGECLTSKLLPLASDFTLVFYVKSKFNSLGWLLNFSGIDNYLEKWIDVIPDTWQYFAFVKQGATFTAYSNNAEVQKVLLSANPVGFSLNDPSLFGSNVCFDEVKMYNVAKTLNEIIKLQSVSPDIEYYVDGQNFKDFGVSVKDSLGLFGMLERKDSLSIDYESYHGVYLHKKFPRYKERTVTLDCFIEALRSDFTNALFRFLSCFDRPETQRLTVEYDGKEKPLVYEVYSPSATDIQKRWTYGNELMVGEFKLKLVECEPVKRVLRHIGVTADTQATITVSTYKKLNIYWGDGTRTFNISGLNQQIAHTYSQIGTYDIIITGVIEEIEAFATNCIVVWDKLM